MGYMSAQIFRFGKTFHNFDIFLEPVIINEYFVKNADFCL